MTVADDAAMIDVAARAADPDAFLGWGAAYARTLAASGGDEGAALAAANGAHGARVDLARARATSALDAVAMARSLATGRVSTASRLALLDEVRRHASRVGSLPDPGAPAVRACALRLLRVLSAEVDDVAPSEGGMAETDDGLAEDRLRVARRVGAWAELSRADADPAGVVVGLKSIAMALARGRDR